MKRLAVKLGGEAWKEAPRSSLERDSVRDSNYRKRKERRKREPRKRFKFYF